MVWLVILVIGSFWLTIRDSSDPVSLTVAPEVPRQGQPILVTFRLSNQLQQSSPFDFKLYANAKLIQSGLALLPPLSASVYQYAYRGDLPLGEQLNFSIVVMGNSKTYQKHVSTPPYPPYIWSSFVSFASFSTSMMGSMSNMTYYQSSFADIKTFNTGLFLSLALIGLLIFLELFQPEHAGYGRLGKIRGRFSTVSLILLMIFLSMTYTRIVLILNF